MASLMPSPTRLRKSKVEVWAWRAVRGSLPSGSPAARVSDYLATATALPPAPVMLRLFIHLSLRFVLGCGDTGFHNCLVGGVGLDYEDNRGFGGTSGVAFGVTRETAMELLLGALAPAGKLGGGKWQGAVAEELSKAAGDVAAVVRECDVEGLEGFEVMRLKYLLLWLSAIVSGTCSSM